MGRRQQASHSGTPTNAKSLFGFVQLAFDSFGEQIMDITIGRFDRRTGTVPVTFSHEGVVHTRPVNACLTASGRHDRKATSARVDEVALGVREKIAAGVITNPLVVVAND